MDEEFFEKLREKSKGYFRGDDGHGFDHVQRVHDLALNISDEEDVDMDVVRAAALLHDVARAKEAEFDVCHAEEGSKMAEEILKEMNFPVEKIANVVHSILVHRYSKGLKAETREAEILQAADRLDALGAITLSRVFTHCGKTSRPVYDPEILPKDYYDGKSTTGVNHLYEKIFGIKPESFKTQKARDLAVGRYEYVKNFVEQFEKEWVGEL